MSAITDYKLPELNEGDRIGEYAVKRVAELKEISSFFYELEHLPTGAGHIHIANKDSENTFSVAFKTVPRDSTGVAHILEHTALCGSQKFPVRDPFFSMIKRSLNTFMNAFTASDWTMYPFSTQNRKDFYNLLDVYLDAAFFPRLDILNFKQEGHRLELEGDQLVYKGVVYNEMKGAMSSPDQILVRSLLNALYPETTYSYNSGGEPADIPGLTHEQLLEFHRRHYHPSNAFFYTYGNLPLEDHLTFIQDKILKQFGRIDPKTDVPSQPRWDSPKTVRYSYPLAQNEDPLKKYQICLSWLTADINDTFEVLSLILLEHILLGTPASPLRRALIESGIGTALSDGTGFDSDNRDTMFTCGLKDVKESDASAVESLILDVFKSLADKGVDPKLADSAIHQVEFHRKEITNHPYPYGIKLLLAVSSTWFHGGDPVRVLRLDDDLQRLADERAKGSFFENLIRTYFLDNPHRVLFKLVPDQTMEQKEEERIRAELAQLKAGLSPADLDQIKKDAESLEKLQEAPEDLSMLPTLEIEDIPPWVQIVEETRYDGTKTEAAASVSFYQQPTSGIFYFDAAAGAGNLDSSLIPLVPFFCHIIPQIGTKRRDYSEMAQLIDAYTGGLGFSAHARTDFGPAGDCLPFITLNGKCLERNQDNMFDIIEELFYEFDFSDLGRLKNLLLEYRAALEASVVHNGHGLAMSLASRNFSQTRLLTEIWSGVHQLKAVKEITDQLTDERLKSLSENLTAVGKHILSPDNLKMAFVGEEAALSQAVSRSSRFKSTVSASVSGFVQPGIFPGQEIPREGWSTASAVSFTGCAFKTVRMDHADAPALSLIAKLLRSLYLHREIREKGGAYGAYAIYNSEDGLFCFASYRDPHIVSTLNAYKGAEIFINSDRYGDEDIKEAVLQVCSETDKPDPPGTAARKAFYRKLIALSDDARKRFKEQLLSLTRRDILKVAEKYFNADEARKGIAVISGEEKLKAANGKMQESPFTLYRI
jgi:Zn-dependent M16 (insulinase) family peptidase